MNDMERQEFEESFRNAFDDAGVTPSDNVWTNVELELEKASGDKMRRRILFYKLLAAACVAFAMCVASIGFYAVNYNGVGTTAEVNHSSTDKVVESQQSSENPTGNTPSDVNSNSATDDNLALSEKSDGIKGTTESDRDQVAEDAGAKMNVRSSATDESAMDDNAPKKSLSGSGADANKQNLIAEQKTLSTTASSKKDKKILSGHSTEREVASAATRQQNTQVKPNSANVRLQEKELVDRRSSNALATNTGLPVSEKQLIAMANQSLPALVKLKKIEVQDPRQVEADPVAAMMLRLAREEQAIAAQHEKTKNKKKNQITNENLWTSLGVAAGQFNSYNGAVSPTTATMASSNGYASSQIKNQEAKATGSSYSVGMSVGKKLSNKWVLQGGLSYLNQSSDYTAEGLIRDGNQNFSAPSVAALDELNKMDISSTNAKYVPSTPYDVTNSLEFISVPVQAGYLIVNRKIGVQLNAGVSTDVFLQNTISSKGDVQQKETYGQGSDSQYRTWNFSGLMGTEFSYRMGQHYRVALNPGLRYPFNSIYKSGSSVQANPLTFDVGLKFRYIFH
jgi:hypothetical protein